MNTPPPVLELVSLHKRFGDKTVLEGVSLSLAAGSICTLLGRNGAGKTTAIRLMMGQLRPSEGEVRVFGHDIGNPAAHHVWRKVGYLAAEPVLYEHLSGREFLHFLSEVYGAPHSRIASLHDQIEVLGLLPYIDAPIRTYSLGTKKKTAFLASILHEPDILILDEPTASLDAVSARAIRDTLRAERDMGKLVLLATHSLDDAERISDRVVLIHGGRLHFDGTPSELKSRFGKGPRETFEDLFIRVTEKGYGSETVRGDSLDGLKDSAERA